MRYYRVVKDNELFADRWFLDEPIAHDGSEIDAREFTYGSSYDGPLPVRIPIQVGRCCTKGWLYGPVPGSFRA